VQERLHRDRTRRFRVQEHWRPDRTRRRRVPAHWHPADEHITVISGTFYMGMADKLDEAAAKELPAGSFVVMPAKHHHFALTKSETVVQLHGMGPWGINYVNPTDDPRKAAASK